ncbi:MAG: hypothetical protein KDC03_22845, partial [Flavobacteriales bacterium]|nr:hypothetical protein [Flavobacteriales bacterium]
ASSIASAPTRSKKSARREKPRASENPKFIVDQARELDKLYRQHSAWVEKRRQGVLREGRLFASCARSALAKLYDFNRTITRIILAHEPIEAFFLAGTLRGICEDVIVLSYLNEVPNRNRDKLLYGMLKLGISSNLTGQAAFFSKNRPQQPVLHPGRDANTRMKREALQAEWEMLGWTLGRRQSSPSTRDIAQRSGLVEVYDFFYRFACDIVHFNPGVLLRFGWGDDDRSFRYSANNYNIYYQSFALVYGAYLWCLMLQVLRRHLKLPAAERDVEKQIITWLHQHKRWPEMVTWEEMNLDRPNARVNDFIHDVLVRLRVEGKPIIRRKKG